ncbi:MAG: DNA-directed RNA polymerase subunit alpha [bacterium]
MEYINLPSMTVIQETEAFGSFSIEPLFPGYGSTLGNAMRRVLLSSLEGAAVDFVEIEGVQHEFSTIPGVKEDVIQLLLNLKTLRFKLNEERAELTLEAKGPGAITAASFGSTADCSVVNTDLHIATLDKGATLSMRIGVKRGRGYEPVEKKEDRSKTVGVITTDSIYSPVLAVSYKVENTRVGQMTNYDKLVLDITTDGSIAPVDALKKAAVILTEQYAAIAQLPVSPLEADESTFESHEEIIVTDDAIEILHTLDPKTKVEDAGLSGRTAHALQAAGYKTLSGLKRLSDIKLQSIKGLGAKGVDEVRAVLSRVE